MRVAIRTVMLCVLGLVGGAGAKAADHAADRTPADAAGTGVVTGTIFEDRDGDGRRDRGERGLAGVAVSNGRDVVRTGGDGGYRLPAGPGATLFVIKPAGWVFADDGREKRPGTDAIVGPVFWRHLPPSSTPTLRYGGLVSAAAVQVFDRGLRRAPAAGDALELHVFADPQVKSTVDVGYYARDIIDDALADRQSGSAAPTLGLSLGDIVNDDLSLYPALDAETRRLGVPWLHVAGNHDMDLDAARDEDALLSFRDRYGPDTFAWEEREAIFIGLDDVIFQPGRSPAYIGGFREDQFAFLQAYLAEVPKDRRLVLAVHIPLFEAPGRDTFRDADRERLFALLRDFPDVLVLSGHAHTQQHWWHDAASGWHGATPLHEYNVGAACGAYWAGAKDPRGIPDARMSDGTPNGRARLRIARDGTYALAWRVAGVPADADNGIGLHAPRVLRRGAYPAWGVYANVWMGMADSRVEYRVDGGAWRAMTRVDQADPALLAENARDDLADTLRGYDRSPEATVSAHLWRGTLPTGLAIGEHRVEVRAFDRWRGELHATTTYRLDDAPP